jgi:hypothetical protein
MKISDNPASILLLLFCLVFFVLHGVHAQELRFHLIVGEHGLTTLPVRVPLEDFRAGADSLQLRVFREYPGRRVALKSQGQPGDPAQLWFVPDAPIAPGAVAQFVVVAVKSGLEEQDGPGVEADSAAIRLTAAGRPVLEYRKALQPAPPGVDALFAKSGFIHPLYSPSGVVLTRIQPPDHYHHYGIWNPWTVVRIGGEEVDFWNLGLGQGTVRYAGTLGTTAGAVYSGFRLVQEHVQFRPGGDRVVLMETWELRSFPVELEGKPCNLIDLVVTLHNNLGEPVELSDYHYGGGIGFRATEHWTRHNSRVLTSEGKTRRDADGSTARWCLVEGEFPGGTRSGIVFFSHPGNRAHPEPMRVWPEDAVEGRGDLFFEFCPIRHQKWRAAARPGVRAQIPDAGLRRRSAARRHRIRLAFLCRPVDIRMGMSVF